jgi:hypothetical protein
MEVQHANHSTTQHHIAKEMAEAIKTKVRKRLASENAKVS